MKNKEKNVLQPHILTKYHEIDVLDRNGAIRKKQCFLWGPHVWHKITRWTFLCKTLLKNWNNNLIGQKSGGAKAPPAPPSPRCLAFGLILIRCKSSVLFSSGQLETGSQYPGGPFPQWSKEVFMYLMGQVIPTAWCTRRLITKWQIKKKHFRTFREVYNSGQVFSGGRKIKTGPH